GKLSLLNSEVLLQQIKTRLSSWSAKALSFVDRNSTKGMLIRLCWQACIYWIWMERNARLHRQTFHSTDSIARNLDRQIKDRILSFRDSNPSSSSRLMQQWLA
ncbi:hypothetical protein HID58_002726, partial [Brassica napus]